MTNSVLTRSKTPRSKARSNSQAAPAAPAADNGRFRSLDTEALGISILPPYVPVADTAEMPAVETALKYEILSDKLVTLSKDKCTEYLSLQPFAGERNPGADSTQHLIDEMSNRTFNPSNVILASAAGWAMSAIRSTASIPAGPGSWPKTQKPTRSAKSSTK